MGPIATSALLNTAGALPGFVNSFQQDALRRKLMAEGAKDPTPLAFKQMQAGLENQANNAQIAGYGQAMDNINEQQATTLGEAKRAGLSSSNLLNTLSRLNQQSMASKRQLAMQGQQAREQRLNRALSAQGQRGQYQEQGRREFDATIGALKGAAQQQRNAFYQAPFTGALAGMRYGAGATKTTTPTDNISTGPAPTMFVDNKYYANNKGTAYNPNTDPSLPSTYPSYFTSNANGSVSPRMMTSAPRNEDISTQFAY